MRKKKRYVILTFATTTAAMATEKQCGIRRIPGRLIPLPAEISAGCGLAWRMLPEEYELYETQLKGLGQEFEQVVELEL